MFTSSQKLYGVKQAPRAWYERLRDFLLSKDFKIGKVDTTLFTKIIGDDFFIEKDSNIFKAFLYYWLVVPKRC